MNGPHYILRPMRTADIQQVMVIDRAAFPSPWSASIYHYEVTQNPLSTMVTLCLAEDNTASSSGLPRLVARLLGRPGVPGGAVIGYGGFWFSHEEAHVSTIAVMPVYQGRGLGELLLLAMIRRGLALGAAALSLEVRISNARAIALYKKHEFTPHGVKRQYYRDNREDAYDMRVDPIPSGYAQRAAARWSAVVERIAFEDRFTTA